MTPGNTQVSSTAPTGSATRPPPHRPLPSREITWHHSRIASFAGFLCHARDRGDRARTCDLRFGRRASFRMARAIWGGALLPALLPNGNRSVLEGDFAGIRAAWIAPRRSAVRARLLHTAISRLIGNRRGATSHGSTRPPRPRTGGPLRAHPPRARTFPRPSGTCPRQPREVVLAPRLPRTTT